MTQYIIAPRDKENQLTCIVIPPPPPQKVHKRRPILCRLYTALWLRKYTIQNQDVTMTDINTRHSCQHSYPLPSAWPEQLLLKLEVTSLILPLLLLLYGSSAKHWQYQLVSMHYVNIQEWGQSYLDSNLIVGFYATVRPTHVRRLGHGCSILAG